MPPCVSLCLQCDTVLVLCLLFLAVLSWRKCHSLDPALQLWRLSLHCVGQCGAWSSGGVKLQVLDPLGPLPNKDFHSAKKKACLKNLTLSSVLVSKMCFLILFYVQHSVCICQVNVKSCLKTSLHGNNIGPEISFITHTFCSDLLRHALLQILLIFCGVGVMALLSAIVE